MLPEIFVYGKDNCSFCKNAVNLLDGFEIPYQYIDIEKHEEITPQYLTEKIAPGMRTVPVITINGVVIGGYNELRQYILENYDDEGKQVLYG